MLVSGGISKATVVDLRTSPQCADGPDTQRGVVDQLHSGEQGEPGGRGLFKEFIMVIGNVIFAESMREIGDEP
jgi:hypothetical protein